MAVEHAIRSFVYRIASLLAAVGLAASSTLYAASASGGANAAAATPVEVARSNLRMRQFAAALERLRPAAAAGDAEAQFLLGEIYLAGVGTPVDEEAATGWLQKAAQQQHAAAAFVLAAQLTRKGPAAAVAARDWLQQSAKLGYPRAVDAVRDNVSLLAADRAARSDAPLAGTLARYAARQNDLPLLQTLGKPALTALDEFGRDSLATACAAGALQAVTWLLANGSRPDQPDSFGVTSLMLAADLTEKAKGSDIVALLLQHGAGPAALDREKRSALFYAAHRDNAATIKLLAAAGASVSATDSSGYTALDAALTADAGGAAAELRRLGARQSLTLEAHSVHGKFDAAHPGAVYSDWPVAALAAARNDSDELKRLLTAGTQVSTHTPQGDSLLHVALHAQALGAMQLLLSAGADAIAPDRRGRSVLALSANLKDPAMLRLLLNSGVGADQHAANEDPPLLQAVAGGNLDAAAALLASKARADLADSTGKTPLLLAASLGNSALLDLLLENGADVRQRNRNGQSALWLAARTGNVALVQRLLARGAEVESADVQGRTPLMVAAAAGHAGIVELLMRANARPDAVTTEGDSALLLAASAGRSEVLPLLMRSVELTNRPNGQGDTALIVASRQGHAEVCRILLKAGASPSVRNKNAATAADVARERGFGSLADEIERRT